jgi:hypothetical protein
MIRQRATAIGLTLFLIFILACNLPFFSPAPPASGGPIATPALPNSLPPGADTPTPAPPPTNTPVINHQITPSTSPPLGTFVYDVDTSGTGAEKRAPYGDSYRINRFERPFLGDMTYVPDLDIVTFNLSKDSNFYYVSIELIGKDPNNPMGINYGVEMDLNADGFGDIMILAHGPYTTDWGTTNVQVLKDSNRDTGGLSGERSDAPIETNGYDTFLLNDGQGDDPDLAWVRMMAGQYATLQFAFKRSLSGSSFMMGTFADAGLKDPAKFDYNDRFTEEEAGSPEKSEALYPLKALYKVDNTCREAFGFNPTGDEPQLCPKEPPPTKHPGATPTATQYIIP